MNPEERKFVSLQAAAKLYDVHPKTLRRAISDGELKAVRLGKRHAGIRETRPLRIPLDSLTSWVTPVGSAR